MESKLAVASMGGVFLPIVIEFGAKGARISNEIPVKISGLVGTGLGLFTGVIPAVWDKCPWTKNLSEKNKAALIAFGCADFATGLSILILDELKKAQAYQFGEVPIGMGAEGLEVPPDELVKEI